MQHTMIKAGLLLGVAATGMTVATPALAQSGDNTASGGGGDIIVTAQRIEQRLQDVPISITVFNQQQLTNRNVVTATDLATYTPSLSVNQRYGPEKAAFAIRGFVQDGPTSPSVGVYFADVVAPRAQGGTTSGNNAPTGSFMDLQNVQVLKGPQGTLFGRNTTGGAVLLVPRKPTDNLEGYIEGSAGDFNMWRTQGVLNVPLADTFKVRLALDRNKRQGYMINHSNIGAKNYNDINYFAARLSIIADLTPDLENYTIGTYSNSFSRGYGARISLCDPTNFRGGAIFTTLPACDQIARQNARGDGPLDVDIDNPDPYLKLRTWQFINTTTWRASDTLTVKNIVSYQEFRERTSFNLYGDNFTSHFPTGVPLPNGVKFQYIVLNPVPSGDNSAQSTFSEELQFQGGTADGRLTWQAGGYFELGSPLGWSEGRTGILLTCTSPENLACVNPFGAGQISASRTKLTFNDKGLYAQASYKLTDQLSVTGGIRYTWDKVSALNESTRISPQANGTFIQTCNDVVRFNNGKNPITGAVIPVVVSSQAQCRFASGAKSRKPTWLIDIDYKPTDDILLYAKYARGYRQGGVNPTAIGLEGYGPEKVDAYEIGAKASFSGAVSGYFNFAGFYNDFSNQQLVASAISNVAGFSGANPVTNAGQSRIKGIEVDSSATFFHSLRVDVGYTYLDTKVISATAPAVPPGAPYSQILLSAAAGDPLALSPKHRVSLSGTYTFPLPESFGQLSVGANYVYTSEQVITKATAAQFIPLPATNLVNVNVNWDKALGSPVDVAFFMTNVTNKIYPVSVAGAYASAGFESLLYGPPRMWGFRLRYSFGQ